jgi:outer membrane protein
VPVLPQGALFDALRAARRLLIADHTMSETTTTSRARGDQMPRRGRASAGAVLALFALGPAAARAQVSAPGRRSVSLREALQLAAKLGPDVEAARARAAIAEVQVERAYDTWKPDVTATGTYDHTSTPQSIDIGAITLGAAQVIGPSAGFDPNSPAVRARAALVPPKAVTAANSRYGTLQLSQPVFTPQGLFLPGIAGSAAEAAEHAASETREQVLLGVSRIYLTLQGIKGLLGAALDLEKVALRREKDARARIAAGSALQLDLLRAQNDTAVARAQIASLLGQQRALLPSLESLVGEAVAPLPAAQGTESLLEIPADEAAQPWEHTFSVRSAKAQVIAFHRSISYDDFRWIPSVSAIARGNYNSNGGFSGDEATYDLILGVSIPLYDHGERYTQKHEDEAGLRQSLANLASARAQAKATWQAACANLAAAQAVLEQDEAQVRVARRTQEQTDVSFREGVATSLDLTDADNRLFQAQSAAAQARVNVDIRRAEIVAAEGRLYEEAAL